MSLFDNNRWYQITIPYLFKTDLSMAALPPDPAKDASSVFFQNTNKTLPRQHWQLFFTSDSKYILRPQSAGPENYLAVWYDPAKQTETGGITAIVRNVKAAGPEALWTIKPYKNGGYSMKNQANGTSWNLFVKDAASMAMTSNIQGEQDNQSFNFTRLGMIDDQKYSTIQTPSQLPSTTSNPIGTIVPQPANNDSGLSSGAKIGIGVGAGLVVLIALLLGVFFLLRRRKQKNAIKQSPLIGEYTDTLHMPYDPPKYGYHYPETTQYQQHYGDVPQELGTRQAVVEARAEIRSEISEMDGAAAQKPTSPVELATEAPERR